MKTLIVYGTKYGFTAQCAKELKAKLGGDTTVTNLQNQVVSPVEFDQVIIGGSFYAGKIQPEVSRFCSDFRELLMEKKVGIFVCGANREAVQEQMNTAFDSRLLQHAVAKEYFGYAIDFSKLNFFFKMIVRAVMKTNKSETKMLEENIQKMADVFR